MIPSSSADRKEFAMSHSMKKTPVVGNASHSEKEDKRIANRKMRRIVRTKLHTGREELPVSMKEVSDIWTMAKDGKSWMSSHEAREKYMRK